VTAWREHFRRISTGRGRGAPLFSESDVEHLFARNTDNVLRQEKKENFEVHCTRTRPRRHGPVQCSPAAFASRLVRVAFRQDPKSQPSSPLLLPFSCGPHAAAGRQSHPGGPACVRTSPAGQSHGSHSHPAHAPRGVLLSSSSTIPHGKCACGAAGSVRARSRWPSPSPY
jgi:hypothetical protein